MRERRERLTSGGAGQFTGKGDISWVKGIKVGLNWRGDVSFYFLGKEKNFFSFFELKKKKKILTFEEYSIKHVSFVRQITAQTSNL